MVNSLGITLGLRLKESPSETINPLSERFLKLLRKLLSLNPSLRRIDSLVSSENNKLLRTTES